MSPMRFSLSASILLAASCVAKWGNDASASSALAEPETVEIERVVLAMGTTLHLKVSAPDRRIALSSSEAALKAMETVTERLSTWIDDSELQRLNHLPVGRSMQLSGALLEDLRKARFWQRKTGGAFDPGIGALVDLYQLRSTGRWPSDQEVWSCLPHSTMSELQVIHSNARRMSAKLRLEEGGFAKGAGLDAAADAVLKAGATSVTFDFGGQTLCVGAAANPTEFQVADPADRAQPVVSVLVDRGSLATTGNSERRIQVGDAALGHILDPRTGRPASDFGSVTVWTETAFAADCLSTGLFVMGPDAALAFAEETPGLEILVLQTSTDTASSQTASSQTASSQTTTARMTSGMRRRVTALSPGVVLK